MGHRWDTIVLMPARAIGKLLTACLIFKVKIWLSYVLVENPETRWQVPDFVITIGKDN